MSEPNQPNDPPAEDDQTGQDPPWDAVEVMRVRAAAARRERDRSIAELRERMSDEEIRETFGIDLDELGD